MSLIQQVESDILTASIAALPSNVLKETGSLPGSWTLDTLKRALQFAPGVYVSFLGGQADQINNARIAAKFEVYIVTKGAVARQRQQGTLVSIGAYELLQSLIPALHQLQITDAGVLKLESVKNLFSEAMFNLGGTVYGLSFTLPMYFDAVVAVEPLAQFLTFTANADTVALP